MARLTESQVNKIKSDLLKKVDGFADVVSIAFRSCGLTWHGKFIPSRDDIVKSAKRHINSLSSTCVQSASGRIKAGYKRPWDSEVQTSIKSYLEFVIDESNYYLDSDL